MKPYLALAAVVVGLRRPRCAYCGKRLHGDTYILQAGRHYCSETCWNAWHDDRARWESDGGQ